MAYKRTSPQPVVEGGTGDTSFTAYSVLCGGTTSTGGLQNVSGLGTSGQVLTSNGASTLPTWQPGGGGMSVVVTGTDVTNMAVNTTYILTNTVFTQQTVNLGLPTTATFGDIINIVTTDISGNIMSDSGGFKITQGATNYMIGLGWDSTIGDQTVGSTPGVTGYAASWNQFTNTIGSTYAPGGFTIMYFGPNPGVSDGWVVVSGSQAALQSGEPFYVFA